jgi:hypothetical protein
MSYERTSGSFKLSYFQRKLSANVLGKTALTRVSFVEKINNGEVFQLGML